MRTWPSKCQQLYDKAQFYAERMLRNPATADSDEVQFAAVVDEISRYLKDQETLNEHICKCCGKPKCS